MRSRGGYAPAIAAGSIAVALLAAAGDARAVTQCGEAAWYAPGGITASGEPNAAGALTAAHQNLPFGTKVRVVNLANGKSVVVRVNDRGGFSGNRIIDLSRAAAEALGYISKGVARVQVTVLGDVAVKLPRTCKPADAEAAAAAGDRQEVAIREADPPAAERPPIPESRPAPEPVAKQGMSARFSLAFQPDTWSEAELRKALEAFLPALRP